MAPSVAAKCRRRPGARIRALRNETSNINSTSPAYIGPPVLRRDDNRQVQNGSGESVTTADRSMPAMMRPPAAQQALVPRSARFIGARRLRALVLKRRPLRWLSARINGSYIGGICRRLQF
ncbi:hypothetical protein KCP77_11890 [Salmonella enterica subsp. enterica]|nr:hypothetical protein KCP77_11890 [Salmonella enterica subsp. enterica]